MTRLEGVAGVRGVVAVYLERLMRQDLERVRAIPQVDVREQLLEGFADLCWAAEVWRASAVVSAAGRADTGVPDIRASSAGEEISAGEAMRVLAISSDRQLRRLAAAEGLGDKDSGGRWRLSRDAVLALGERRRSA